jgi:SAM-dependent methyltransferase
MELICPICNAVGAFECKTSEADLWRCPNCDHCFTDISSVETPEDYDNEYFQVTHRNWFENPNTALFEGVSKFIAHYKPDASLIDVGCGNGAFLKYVRNRNPHLSLTGIDIARNEPAEGVRFIQGDVLAAEFDRQYDVVVSLAVIEHVLDVKNFIKCLHSLCSPHGFVIVMTLNERSTLYKVARLLRNLGFEGPFERLYSKHHLHHFTPSSLRLLLESNGFSVVKLLRHNAPLAAIDFDSPAPLVSAFLRAGVWGTFMIGSLVSQTYLQTIICQKNC